MLNYRVWVKLMTRDVPGAFADSFANYKDATALYTLAFGQGLVYQMVEVGGVHDKAITPPCGRRLSGTSSIWGEVSDIDSIAAEWSG